MVSNVTVAPAVDVVAVTVVRASVPVMAPVSMSANALVLPVTFRVVVSVSSRATAKKSESEAATAVVPRFTVTASVTVIPAVKSI